MESNVLSMTETIRTLIKEKKYSVVKEVLTTLKPVDIAYLFEEMAEDRIPILFRLLPKETAADTFVEMDEEMQELLIRDFSDTELKEIVDELYIDDAVDIIEEMPANVVKRILKQADPDTRKLINELLKYPDDSAGSIMTTEYVSLRPNMTVEEAIKRIRRTGVDKETIYTCYVTLDNRTLIGLLSIKALLLANEDDRIFDIMESNVIAVHTLDDQENVAQKFDKYGFMALPVVDNEGRLVGIVTVDDAIDVIQEEATEDIEKMAAIMPSDKPYLKTGVFEIYLKRIPWLLVLMISATFTQMIIHSFESALASQIALSAFIPMLMGTGGNSGSQSSVTVIRGLSLKEIEFRDILKVLFKEIRISVLCGLTLAIANFLKLVFIDKVPFEIALTVCITLVIVVVCAKITGCSLPMLAQKIGFDPAIMANPLITTVVDVMSLLVYFNVAASVLNI